MDVLQAPVGMSSGTGQRQTWRGFESTSKKTIAKAEAVRPGRTDRAKRDAPLRQQRRAPNPIPRRRCSVAAHSITIAGHIDTDRKDGLYHPRRRRERSLIVERVKAGLRNARAKGKRLGRPKGRVDSGRIDTPTHRPFMERNRPTDGPDHGTVQRAFYGQKAAPALPKKRLA